MPCRGGVVWDLVSGGVGINWVFGIGAGVVLIGHVIPGLGGVWWEPKWWKVQPDNGLIGDQIVKKWITFAALFPIFVRFLRG